jgi:hypothetical protein
LRYAERCAAVREWRALDAHDQQRDVVAELCGEADRHDALGRFLGRHAGREPGDADERFRMSVRSSASSPATSVNPSV